MGFVLGDGDGLGGDGVVGEGEVQEAGAGDFELRDVGGDGAGIEDGLRDGARGHAQRLRKRHGGVALEVAELRIGGGRHADLRERLWSQFGKRDGEAVAQPVGKMGGKGFSIHGAFRSERHSFAQNRAGLKQTSTTAAILILAFGGR